MRRCIIAVGVALTLASGCSSDVDDASGELGRGAQAATPGMPFSILSYNVALMPLTIDAVYPQNRNLCRAARLGHVLASAPVDVIVLQETFSHRASGELFKRVRSTFPHQVHYLPPDTFLGVPFNGGLAVLSRWPIEVRKYEVYRTRSGWDRWAQKGFLHVRALLPGNVEVEIITTHLDSNDAGVTWWRQPNDELARRDELRQLTAYIDALAAETDAPIVLAGDFNINGIDVAAGAEYRALMDALADGAQGAAYDSYREVRDAWPAGDRTAETWQCDSNDLTPCRDPALAETDDIVARLDYVFYYQNSPREIVPRDSRHLAFRDDTCGTTYLSDHKAVLTRLELSL